MPTGGSGARGGARTTALGCRGEHEELPHGRVLQRRRRRERTDRAQVPQRGGTKQENKKSPVLAILRRESEGAAARVARRQNGGAAAGTASRRSVPRQRSVRRKDQENRRLGRLGRCVHRIQAVGRRVRLDWVLLRHREEGNQQTKRRRVPEGISNRTTSHARRNAPARTIPARCAAVQRDVAFRGVQHLVHGNVSNGLLRRAHGSLQTS
mmetsp:Transcript_8986/g.24154  ORF Transcript_8986/g.24154 Transcript_8986/m.24154 type:complete len:210 (+) Transcript_8986:474-1103(+)